MYGNESGSTGAVETNIADLLVGMLNKTAANCQGNADLSRALTWRVKSSPDSEEFEPEDLFTNEQGEFGLLGVINTLLTRCGEDYVVMHVNDNGVVAFTTANDYHQFLDEQEMKTNEPEAAEGTENCPCGRGPCVSEDADREAGDEAEEDDEESVPWWDVHPSQR
jgi:hypothetical protein